ncbi:MAG: hypothetical protein NUV80_01255 [Candidatus Berkelbacteria bacterium]|nr:hypothetical protein [Candidatus Berkelbacteria bacterium]
MTSRGWTRTKYGMSYDSGSTVLGSALSDAVKPASADNTALGREKLQCEPLLSSDDLNKAEELAMWFESSLPDQDQYFQPRDLWDLEQAALIRRLVKEINGLQKTSEINMIGNCPRCPRCKQKFDHDANLDGCRDPDCPYA